MGWSGCDPWRVRLAGAEVPRTAANAFNRVAWPAFGVLTGGTALGALFVGMMLAT